MRHTDQESEIKLLVSEQEAARLREHLGSPGRTLRQVNHFFETPEDHLARASLSLRVREESELDDAARRVFLTVKGAGLRAGALMVRPEVECPLPSSAWDDLQGGKLGFADLDLPPVRKLGEMLGDIGALSFESLGTFENVREVYEISADDMKLELLLDCTTYPPGVVDYEVESELPQALAGKGAKALRELFGELGIDWQPAEVGKYVRFRMRIGRDPREVRDGPQ